MSLLARKQNASIASASIMNSSCSYVPKESTHLFASVTKALFIISMLCVSVLTVNAQTYLKAKINDPDGYTNVRKSQSSSSDIVAKFYDGETFYVQKVNGNNWWPVYTTNGGSRLGYMHSSRVSIIGNSSSAASSSSNSETQSAKDALSTLITQVVKYNNNFFAGKGSEMSNPQIASYCTSQVQSIIATLKKAEAAYEKSTNQWSFDDDDECYFGNGNSALYYYLMHAGDSNFKADDEISLIKKWSISSMNVTGTNAVAKVRFEQHSCYEGKADHSYTSTIKMQKENGAWKVSDMNDFLKIEGAWAKKLARFAK